MSTRNSLLLLVTFIFCLPFSVSAEGGHDHGHGHGHGHEEEEPEKGTHGGRLLEDGKLSLEIAIYQKDVPPQFRVYPLVDGKALSPDKLTVSIKLTRFGEKIEEFSLSPKDSYLTSAKTVEKPHSFEVLVRAEHQGRVSTWHYDSFEGRTELSGAALRVANLEYEQVGARKISNDFRVYGKLVPNENKVAHLIPRFPGVIRDIRKELGDTVKKGEVLAIVESNQGLQPYEIRSYVDGVVIKRHATLGEFVPDTREIFVIADLSEVWADFQVYRDDFGVIEAGQHITVDLGDGNELPATIRYVSPVMDEVTQSRLIRAILPNPTASLRPGQFVTAVLSGAQEEVPLAVKREAVQTFRDWNVVFLTDGHVFQAVPVKLGRRDSKYVEVLSGLEAGNRYVTKNSFIIKADIEKSGASHDH